MSALAQRRAADGAGIDFGAGADHALGVELQGAAAAGGAVFLWAYDVGLVDFDQAEIALVQQLADRRFRAEVAVDGRGLDVAQQFFIEQQLDLRLLGDLAQRAGQRLGGQVQADRFGMGVEAERQAGGDQGRSDAEVLEMMRRAKH